MRHQKQIIITVQYNDASPVPTDEELRRAVLVCFRSGLLDEEGKCDIESWDVEIQDK